MGRRKIRFDEKDYEIDDVKDKVKTIDNIFKKLEKLEETEDSGDSD